MIRAIRRAYGAGWRAGMSERRMVRPGGTRGIKVLVEAENPYKHWSQFLLNHAWFCGWHAGSMKRTNDWLASRGRV